MIAFVFCFIILVAVGKAANEDLISKFGVLPEKISSIIFSDFMTFANETKLNESLESNIPLIKNADSIKSMEGYCRYYNCMMLSPASPLDECINSCLKMSEISVDEIKIFVLALKFSMILDLVPSLIGIYGLGYYGTSTKVIFSKSDLKKIIDIVIPVLANTCKKSYMPMCNNDLLRLTLESTFEDSIGSHIGDKGNIDFVDAVTNSQAFKDITTTSGLSEGAIIAIAVVCVVVVLVIILVPTLLVLKKKGKICNKKNNSANLASNANGMFDETTIATTTYITDMNSQMEPNNNAVPLTN